MSQQGASKQEASQGTTITLAIVKPDGVARGLISECISRFESKGLKVKAAKLVMISESQAKQLYKEHEGKPFYQSLIDLTLSGPAFVMVIEARDAVNVVRSILGATNPREAAPGTIRGDFGTGLPENIIHGSDSDASAKREIAIFFTEEELLDYDRTCDTRLGKE